MTTRKMCPGCKEEKDTNQFRRDRSRKDGMQHRCRLCASGQIKSDYTARYGEKVRARSRATSRDNRKWLVEVKQVLGCAICSEREPICLDFHHLDPAEKDFNITTRMASNLELIKRELRKCICVCSNCHRKLHADLIDLPSVWKTIDDVPESDAQ